MTSANCRSPRSTKIRCLAISPLASGKKNPAGEVARLPENVEIWQEPTERHGSRLEDAANQVVPSGDERGDVVRWTNQWMTCVIRSTRVGGSILIICPATFSMAAWQLLLKLTPFILIQLSSCLPTWVSIFISLGFLLAATSACFSILTLLLFFFQFACVSLHCISMKTLQHGGDGVFTCWKHGLL